MKKAKKSETETSVDLGFSDKEMTELATFLDVSNSSAAKLRKKIKLVESRLREDVRSIETYTTYVKDYTENKIEREKELATAREKLAALPQSTYTVETAREEIKRCRELPWIASINISNGWLTITTVPGVLQTTFYQRLAYFEGHRTEELLEAPITLPLPTYTLVICLENFQNQASWTRNGNALRLGLAIPSEASVFLPSMGWNHEPHAHWATNEQGRRAGETGDVCLGDYDSNMTAASKRGLYDFLNELAVYLQTSGWQSAYRNKLSWAALLGNPTYNRYLTREVESRKELDQIVEKNRGSLQPFLKKYGLTMNEYLYGSVGSDETAVEDGIIARAQELLVDADMAVEF